jgi:hypothetical protein
MSFLMFDPENAYTRKPLKIHRERSSLNSSD